MNDYTLRMTKDGKFYCSIYLRADDRKEAVEQSNEIMNRFPEMEYKAEVIESNRREDNGTVFCWFN
jgi:hypothetical protein